MVIPIVISVFVFVCSAESLQLLQRAGPTAARHGEASSLGHKHPAEVIHLAA